MWQVFGAEISRFSLLVLAALATFGLFWLYYDAWLLRREGKGVPLLAGLILLSLSFLLQGLNLETAVLSSIWPSFVTGLYIYIRALGYVLIIVGLVLSPIQDRPKL